VWIIPNNLHTSLSVQVTAGLILDSDEFCQACAQSLMLRSKPSLAQTWSQKLKPDSWMQHLFGRILKHSHGQAFEIEWTSSLEASLASHSAQQEDEQEMQTQGISGPILHEESEYADLPLFSWKMLSASSAQNSKATNGEIEQIRRFCSMSSESWNDWVTKQRQEYSARLKSEHHTRGSASSSSGVDLISTSEPERSSMWGTIRVGTAKAPSGGGDPSKPEHQYRLENQVMWITPAAQAGSAQEPLYTKDGQTWTGEGRAYRASGMHRTLTLQLQVMRGWATPNTMDALPPRSEEAMDRQATGARQGRTAAANLRVPYRRYTQPQEEQSSILGNHRGSQELNPRWVETLMGLPVGWTMPSCRTPWIIALTSYDCSEMEWSQLQQRGHLSRCLIGCDRIEPQEDTEEKP
jgi:hypothetical protein